MRWTRDVQSALEVNDAPPPFPTVVAAKSEGTDPAMENDRLARGLFGQGDAAALDCPESRQTTTDRDTGLGDLCTYCGRALQDSSGHAGVNHLWSVIPCAHGEFVHAGCMLDRAERLVCGHTDPRPCVACRSERLARTRPPHLAELGDNLPGPRPRGRWPALGIALQFAELLEEDAPRLVPASYVRTGSHHTFEHMVRTHGRSPTSFCSCCAPCSAMPCPCLETLTSIFPAQGNGKRPPPAAVWFSKRTPSNHRASFSDSLIEGSTLHPMSKNFWRASTANGRNT